MVTLYFSELVGSTYRLRDVKQETGICIFSGVKMSTQDQQMPKEVVDFY
jgi:hypothetical protein